MKIANADKLIKHFENVVDVHLFTPAQIITIIDTFSVEVPDGAVSRSDIRAGKFQDEIVFRNERGNSKTMTAIFQRGWNDALDAVADNAPDIFGGAS